MDAAEADFVILVCCAQALGLEPTDDVCPDLDAIANGDGTALEKVSRFKYQLAENVRRRRARQVAP